MLRAKWKKAKNQPTSWKTAKFYVQKVQKSHLCHFCSFWPCSVDVWDALLCPKSAKGFVCAVLQKWPSKDNLACAKLALFGHFLVKMVKNRNFRSRVRRFKNPRVLGLFRKSRQSPAAKAIFFGASEGKSALLLGCGQKSWVFHDFFMKNHDFRSDRSGFWPP